MTRRRRKSNNYQPGESQAKANASENDQYQ